MSHQKHLNKIRRNLRSKEIFQARQKAINSFFCDQPNNSQFPMEVQSSSSSSFSHWTTTTKVQRQLLLQVMDRSQRQSDTVEVNPSQIRHIVQQIMKDRPTLPKLTKLTLFLLSDILRPNSSNRSLSTKCLDLLSATFYRTVFNALRSIAINHISSQGYQGSTSHQQLSVSWFQMSQLMASMDEHFEELHDMYQRYFLILEHQKHLLFEYLSCLNSTNNLQKLSILAFHCICKQSNNQELLHPSLQILQLSILQNQISINPFTAHQVTYLLKYALFSISERSTLQWPIDAHILFGISQFLLSVTEQINEKLLQIVAELITFGIHLYLDSPGTFRQLTDYMLRLMLYLSQFFPTKSQAQQAQLYLSGNGLEIQKWALFCEKVISDELSSSKIDEKSIIACSILRILGENGTQQIQRISQQLSLHPRHDQTKHLIEILQSHSLS